MSVRSFVPAVGTFDLGFHPALILTPVLETLESQPYGETWKAADMADPVRDKLLTFTRQVVAARRPKAARGSCSVHLAVSCSRS